MTEESKNQVTVVDVKMPFWSMVIFMVKWAIAAIPALIILIVFYFASSAAIYGTVLGYFSGKSLAEISYESKNDSASETARSAAGTVTVEMGGKFTSSLNSKDGKHFIKIPWVHLVAANSKAATTLRENKNTISASIYMVLGSKGMKEMLEPGSEKVLANDLKVAINESLGLTEGNGVTEVLGAAGFIVE